MMDEWEGKNKSIKNAHTHTHTRVLVSGVAKPLGDKRQLQLRLDKDMRTHADTGRLQEEGGEAHSRQVVNTLVETKPLQGPLF